MMTVWFLIFFLCCGLFCATGLFAAVVAWMKGYRPWFWVASLGPIGALLMMLRPNLNRATTPEEREEWEQRADWTGGILSGITLFVAMGLPVFGMVAIFSLRSAVVVRPAAVIAVQASSVTVKADEMSVAEPQVAPVESADATKPENWRESSFQENNG